MDAFKSHVIYRFHGFLLDARNRKLRNLSGHEVKLSSRAFDTLVELVQHHGETLSKDHLMGTVWRGLVVEDNNINQAICQVRRALGDSTGEPAFVRTISGKGFCFVADVDIRPETADLPARGGDPERITSPPAAPSSTSSPATDNFRPRYWLHAAFIATAALSLVLVFFNLDERGSATEPAFSDHPRPLNDSATGGPGGTIPDSLAVMPFDTLNGNSSNDLFALALHDELIIQLARVENLKVMSRDSVITAAESGQSFFEIADLLKAESLLTGSILVVAERARINLQLLNAETGVALWSKSFEVDAQSLNDMIAAQGDIAQKVVKALEVEARLPQPESLATLPTQSFKAHRYYLTARNSYNHQDEEEKWKLLGKALELDPDYADANLMFANINSALAVDPIQGYTHEEHLQLALASVDNYIRLEPERTQGYALKSIVLGSRGDWNGAAEQLAMVQRLGANVPDMKHGALIKMSLGNVDEAAHIYEETLITDPSNLYVRGLLMAAHEMTGNSNGARQEYALGNELKSAWWGRTVNVMLTLGRGEPLDSNSLDDFSPSLRAVLLDLHDPAAVGHGVKSYLESGTQNAKEDVFYSALAAYTGDTRMANRLLRTAVEKVSTSIFWAWLPVFAEVRRTEEFRTLLQDAGLVDYWQRHEWPRLCQPHDDTFSCN